jgi:hypothetical protein
MQIAFTTADRDFAFLHSLGQKQTSTAYILKSSILPPGGLLQEFATA